MPLVIAIFVTFFVCSASNASGVSMSDDLLSVCFDQLKYKYKPLVSSKYPGGMPPLADSDLSAIEVVVGSGFRFRDDLRRFYLEVSHLQFEGTAPSRAHGGISSSLYQLITNYYKSDAWVPFCDDSDGYYGISQEEGDIRFFSNVPDSVFAEETYLNLVAFLQSKFLRS
ncbi:MAG: SMI1/KNR4 family protein [Alphaproteobacteria bacterium]|nr:SMI1/KNR4 family protein [Alphaproteobacteria bacterium]